MTLRQRGRITTGSCQHCRRRRLRCDLLRPFCSRCRKDDQKCFYEAAGQLRWVGGMALRGKLASHSGLPNLTATPGHSLLDVNLQESDLLLYFERAVLPRFQIQEGQVEVDFDAVLHDPPLQKAILAVSQAHYTLNSKCEFEGQVSGRKDARQSALSSFRELLNSGITSHTSAQQLFTVNVLLCILDGIIEPSEPSNASLCHLRGGFAILDHWNGATSQMLLQNGLTSHLLSVFATMDLVHALISGDKPYFGSTLWLMFAGVQTWWGCLSASDPFLILLKSFADMASLGNEVFSNLPAKEQILLIERCIPIFEQTLAPQDDRRFDPGSSALAYEQRWNVFCAIYRCCGIIYVQRALRLRPTDDEVVQSATRDGLNMLTNNVLPDMMSHCLIFPILVIGVHCMRRQDQQEIIETLAQTASHLSFGSLPLMTDFLRIHWMAETSVIGWWECFSAISDRAFFF